MKEFSNMLSNDIEFWMCIYYCYPMILNFECELLLVLKAQKQNIMKKLKEMGHDSF